MDKRLVVSRILLVDGVLLVLLAFLHLLSTPIIQKWLARDLTSRVLTSFSPLFLLNHIAIGILLIPFGVSTLYSAAGVRAGHPWARGIAMTNALAILVMPLVVGYMMGIQYYNTPLFLGAAVIITLIGISMFVPLVWLQVRRRNSL